MGVQVGTNLTFTYGFDVTVRSYLPSYFHESRPIHSTLSSYSPLSQHAGAQQFVDNSCRRQPDKFFDDRIVRNISPSNTTF
jgi:hypothetical protein